MASPVYLRTAPAPYTFGLDPAVYLVLLSIERREDEALSPVDLVTIDAALDAHVPPARPSLAAPPPSPKPGTVRGQSAELTETFGLDPARFRASVAVQREDDRPLSAEDLATIRAALAPQALAAE